MDVRDGERARCAIDRRKSEIIEYANQVASSMVERGGGVEDVRSRILPHNQMSVDIYVNVCDSMGANLVNTIVEHVSSQLEEITGCRAGIRVLTNLCVERRVHVSISIPVDRMGWKGVPGARVC